jgi:hypothetical protein
LVRFCTLVFRYPWNLCFTGLKSLKCLMKQQGSGGTSHANKGDKDFGFRVLSVNAGPLG